MKKLLFKNIILLITTMLISFNSYACDCECKGDCSFKSVSNGIEFVALVKVIEYSDFIKVYTDDSEKLMPLSMTVEIVKKYKGEESKKRIKIWGDNGMLCRPYIEYFMIGDYFLIAPQKIDKNDENGKKGDYEFFACWDDYMKVDYEKKIAFGNYTKSKKKISLKKFEKENKK